MANYFVFSSPLQCFFASLTSNQLTGDNYAIYYDYAKSFSPLYPQIFSVTDAKFVGITKLELFDVENLKKEDSVFLSNRYNADEVNFFTLVKKKVDSINLFEEGSNIYLKHHFNLPFLNDYSLILKLKNIIKHIIGRTPSHIYLNEFSRVYSSFPMPQCKKGQHEQIKFNPKVVDKANNKEDRACLFLSQTLAIDGFMSSEEYSKWLVDFLSQLVRKFNKVYYKPHPRDDKETLELILDKYQQNIQLLPIQDRELPAELFLMKSSQLTLIGFFSSTLMYYSSLMNGTSIQLIDMLIEDFPGNRKLIDLRNSLSDIFTNHNIVSLTRDGLEGLNKESVS